MKVYISADIEGISGIVSEQETFPGREHYSAACQLMTAEVNAVIEGVEDAGAAHIVVNDCHSSGLNISPEELDPAAELIRGQPPPLMVAGLDGTFDALLLIGYHAMKGTRAAVLDHTFSSQFVDIRVNGTDMGELGLAAASAGACGVPVALVSGDDKLASEAREFVPTADAVITKTGLGRTAAQCRPPAQVRQELREGVAAALEDLGSKECFHLEPPLQLEVSFVYTETADRGGNIPGVVREKGRSVSATLASIEEVNRLLVAFTRCL